MDDAGQVIPEIPRDRSAEDGSAAAPASRAPGLGRRGLAGHFEMVAGLADSALDGDPESEPSAPRPDPQAAELIDVLVALRERTEGYRTPEDTRILDGLIDELRRRYVQMASRP